MILQVDKVYKVLIVQYSDYLNIFLPSRVVCAIKKHTFDSSYK